MTEDKEFRACTLIDDFGKVRTGLKDCNLKEIVEGDTIQYLTKNIDFLGSLIIEEETGIKKELMTDVLSKELKVCFGTFDNEEDYEDRVSGLGFYLKDSDKKIQLFPSKRDYVMIRVISR